MLLHNFCFGFALLLIAQFAPSMSQTAHNLMERYNNEAMYCRDDGKKEPAFKCSGILIRGVSDDQEIAWELKQGNLEKESFSVAFLRKDTPFSKFPRRYSAGMILYPHFETPADKNTYKVFCAFPVNGHTDCRAGHRCGAVKNDKTGLSRHCDHQGITSLSKWIDHYNHVNNITNGKFHETQCAFDMRTPNAARDFKIVIQANKLLRDNTEYAYRNNELLFHAWNADNPKDLPIEAFFYLLDNEIFTNSDFSKQRAKKFRDDYEEATGERVPIVGIRLPTKGRRGIRFKSSI